MTKKYLLIITIVFVIAVAGSGYVLQTKNTQNPPTAMDQSVIHSQYAGQQTRGIKALSEDDIKGLLSGAGTPFGGMAKPAELNGYPGPRHVLDAIEAKELAVTMEQKMQIEKLYEEMRIQAVDLGKQIIAAEQTIDDEFTGHTVTEESLRRNISRSARIYEQLRFLHLKYHLQLVGVLTPEQVGKYNALRGYTGDPDPCKEIPEGHDPNLWKLHNNCEQ